MATTIEIDFDVFKALTALRGSEATTYSDVIRGLLGVTSQESSDPAVEPLHQGGCSFQGVHFPEGTEFRVTYKRQLYTARIEAGFWLQNGRRYHSPSEAAVAITGSGVNGWRFWECKRPDDVRWRKMDEIRRLARLKMESVGERASDEAGSERLKAEERSLRERITEFRGADRVSRDELHERHGS